MRVPIFESVKASRPFETELDKIVYMMQHSQKLFYRTKAYRTCLEGGNTMKAKQYKVRNFPAFAPCAFFYGGKSRQNVLGLTGLCYLDFDYIEDKQQIKHALEILCQDRNVLMASKSVSGHGLHILIRYEIADLHTPLTREYMKPQTMQKWYQRVFNLLSLEYQQKLGFMVDKQGGHIEFLYIISYAPGMYYNPDAEARLIDMRNNFSK